MTINKTELNLTGPDGSNPLGFLCALGVLRTLTNALPDANIKMAWRHEGARWMPVLKANLDLDNTEFIAKTLCDKLKCDDSYPPKDWDDTCNIPAQKYKTYAQLSSNNVDTTQDRWAIDWVSALACESLKDKKENVDDTAFRTMSGQGHQHFLKQMRLLKNAVTPQHIIEALFGWKYQDIKLNLRLDPTEDRRHAMRWKSPDKDPIRTVWGANCLATQGIPLHPVFAVNNQLETTGFRGHRANDIFWSWPLWLGFLNLDCVRSILALSDIQTDYIKRNNLSQIGVMEVFQSQRIMAGKFRAFSPAQPV